MLDLLYRLHQSICTNSVVETKCSSIWSQKMGSHSPSWHQHTKSHFLYHSTKLAGMSTVVVRTCVPCCFDVFPFRDPMSGPKMCSATMMLSTVMGQFGSSFCLKIWIYLWVLSHPIIRWILHASSALAQSCWVYLDLLSATVVMSMVPYWLLV